LSEAVGRALRRGYKRVETPTTGRFWGMMEREATGTSLASPPLPNQLFGEGVSNEVRLPTNASPEGGRTIRTV